MSSERIKVSKIEIKIGDKTLALSLEEMRQLQEILNDAFPKPTFQIPPATVERQIWVSPWIYKQPTVPRWDRWDITCSGGTTLLALRQ